jgi:hypothetical protein
MFNKAILFVLSIYATIFSDPMNNFDSFKFYESDSVMSSIYTGPIFVTGGAIQGHAIPQQSPEKIGYVNAKQIVLLGDTANEVYTFDSVSYYEVFKGIDTFYVMKILAKCNNIDFYILIELRHGPDYDRIMTFYKNDKPDMMVLWIETSRLKEKQKKEI